MVHVTAAPIDDSVKEKPLQAPTLSQPSIYAQFAATTNKVASEVVEAWRGPLSRIWRESDAFKNSFKVGRGKGDSKYGGKGDGKYGGKGDGKDGGKGDGKYGGTGDGKYGGKGGGQISQLPEILWQTAAPSELAVSAPNGFVSAVIEAYRNHHELSLRPDDVWQAILVQFSFYVNAHAQELKSKFVSFEEKMTLEVEDWGTLRTVDYGTIVKRMVQEQMAKHVDQDLLDWLEPSFSTTTDRDRTAACLSVMATMKQFFDYQIMLHCGIPKVTLLGERADWLQLRAKIDRLLDFELPHGKVSEMRQWHGLLAPVLDKFVEAGDGDEAKMKAWWDKVCDHTFMEVNYEQHEYVSGWITAFAVFAPDGKWRGQLEPGKGQGKPARTWPQIRTEHLPLAVASAPALVIEPGTKTLIQLFAGQVAYNVSSDGRTILPRSDLCVVVGLLKE